jgi:hypothetical protein
VGTVHRLTGFHRGPGQEKEKGLPSPGRSDKTLQAETGTKDSTMSRKKKRMDWSSNERQPILRAQSVNSQIDV